MRYWFILRVVGALLFGLGLSMFVAIPVSLYYDDGALYPILLAGGLTSLVGLVVFLLIKKREEHLHYLSHKEGLAITGLIWLLAGFFGGLPYFFSETFPSFTDCIFESVSGFTTTGATILTNIEAIPKGLLFWRALTHWFGGMGIIVISLAVLPLLGIGGMQLYKAEVPSPTPDKLKPRIKDTARVLWQVYLIFTTILVVLLLLGGMNLFDALCHAFSTVSTGGFSTRNSSLEGFSPFVQWVTTIFMLMSAVNFSLYYHVLRGKPKVLLQNSELKFFLSAFFIAGILVSVAVAINNSAAWEGDVHTSIRYSLLSVASMMTSSGFSVHDYLLWPPLAQCMIMFLMFMGGCAGSTAGGIKALRVELLLRHCGREIKRIIHPRAVVHVKFGGQPVPEEVLSGLWGFLALWLSILFLSTLFICASGVELGTSLSAAFSCINNVGPTFGELGPMETFGTLPIFSKWVLMLCMVLGRLEIYAILLLFVPAFYRP